MWKFFSNLTDIFNFKKKTGMFPNLTEYAEETGKSPYAARKSITELENEGLVKVISQGKQKVIIPTKKAGDTTVTQKTVTTEERKILNKYLGIEEHPTASQPITSNNDGYQQSKSVDIMNSGYTPPKETRCAGIPVSRCGTQRWSWETCRCEPVVGSFEWYIRNREDCTKYAVGTPEYSDCKNRDLELRHNIPRQSW